MSFTYPPARRDDTTDNYHGTIVADPYRWLEDPTSSETRAFVDAQSELGLSYLASLPDRDRLTKRITELWDIPRSGIPVERGGTRVWSHNDGLQNQPVFYVQSDGESSPRVLLDANTLSEDGTVAVVGASLSTDGSLWAYSVSESGSDWQRIRVRNTTTAEDLGDELQFVKFTNIAWHENGFFYSRFPEQDPASTEPSRNMSVHYHRLGHPQEDDEQVFANPDDPDLGYVPVVTDDHRYIVLIEWEGTSPHNGLLYREIGMSEWIRVVATGVARYDFLEHVDGRFVVLTDLDAPNGRIVALPLEDLSRPVELVAEQATAIEAAAAAAHRLAVIRLVDASHVIDLHLLDGTPAGTVDLPGLGSVTGLSGRLDADEMYVGYSDFLRPPAALRWSGGMTEQVTGEPPPIDPSRIVVERRHAVSSDGSEVGMFVIRDRATPLPAPVELYGYGGFNISLTPGFDPARLAFIEAGGVVAVANLRGGSEHGEHWHRQGMLGNKQQVFDDFIACAEKLISDGVGTPDSIGIRGRSNGGLLTAACMLQRPDLFGAVSCGVPVTDMLRYQHFTAGRYWTVEYGDAADPGAFAWLIEYSPIHNVREGTEYPPTLIVTADTDDRVVPMHAFKFAAALQHAVGGASEVPLLLRVESRAGHGMGKPTSKVIEERVDEYSFFLHHLTP